MWFCCDFCKVLRIRSELRKRKLASVTVERVLNIQGNILAAVVANVINYGRRVADVNIMFLPCSSFLSFYLFLFLAYSQQSQIRCLPYFDTCYGLSANLECISEICCMQLAGNTGRKNRHLCTIAQLCRAISSQLRYISAIRKKNLLNTNISPKCVYNMVNFGPLVAEICWRVWSTPTNFNGSTNFHRFHILAALLHGTQVMGVVQTLRH